MKRNKLLKFILLNILLIFYYLITWVFGLEMPFAMGYVKVNTIYFVIVALFFVSIFYVPALLIKYLYSYSNPKGFSINWGIAIIVMTFFWGYSVHKTENIPIDSSFGPFYLFHLLLAIALFTTIKSKPIENS
jgi:hypothetical protein